MGNDLLLLDLSAAPLNQIKMAPSGDGFSILASIQGQEMSQIISASGVDVLNISLPDKSDDFDDSSFECVEGVKCIVDLGQVNKAQGSDSGNLLRGEVGQDVLKGLRGGDKLYGGRDSDRLFGGKGKDLLIGGPGSDFLNGGRGSDVMRGGVGPDTYRLSKGRDVVRGFEVGTDIIQASGIPELSQQGKNVLLSYAVGTTLLRKTALDDVAEWLIPQAGGLELLA